MRQIPSSHAYLAALAVLPILGLQRLASDSSLGAPNLLFALCGDALILSFFLFFAWLIRQLPSARAVSKFGEYFFFWPIAILILSLLICAELLYRRTGELLDLAIIRFAFSHFADIQGAVGSAVTLTDIGFAAFILGIVAVFLFLPANRIGVVLRGALLVIPWGGVLAHAAFDQWGYDETPVMNPRGEYQGRYAHWKVDHEAWLKGQSPWYSRGFLTGLAGGKMMSSWDQLLLEHPAGGVELSFVAPNVLAKPTSPFNILVITLESVRHDVVGAYGSKKGDVSNTPFLDSLARDGWLVENALTTIPHTSKALVGIFCGTFPRFSPLVSEAAPGGLPIDCLPKSLSSIGYATAHFQTAPAEFEDRTGLLNNLGFETHITQASFAGEGWQQFGYIALDDRAMVKPAVAWMKARHQAGKPFLASLLTVLTHHPYSSPLTNGPVSDPAVAYQRYVKALGYTDRWLAEMFTELKQEGVLDNTLIIVTGDHGEAFSEHGLLTHNGVPYDEAMRVPLILWGKMLEKGRSVSGMRQHIDIVPTLLDLLSIQHSGRLPGVSLKRALGHRQLITACFYLDYCLNIYDQQIGKTIYFYGKRQPANFDLINDPEERYDRIGQLSSETFKAQMTSAFNMKRSFEQVYSRD